METETNQEYRRYTSTKIDEVMKCVGNMVHIVNDELHIANVNDNCISGSAELEDIVITEIYKMINLLKRSGISIERKLYLQSDTEGEIKLEIKVSYGGWYRIKGSCNIAHLNIKFESRNSVLSDNYEISIKN